MRVGTVCYAVESGLGLLAKSFFDAGVVNDALVIRHHHHENKGAEWYPGAKSVEARPFDVRGALDFCRSCEVMLFFETPFHWGLLSELKRHKIKTAFMPMYECHPLVDAYRADLYLCASDLDYDYFNPSKGYPNSVRINVPVKVPHRRRGKVTTFVHNAGHLGLRGRNGTREVIEALKYVKSEATVLINTQERFDPSLEEEVARQSSKLDVNLFKGCIPYGKLWENGGEGDCFLFPEKFNGLSLPLQEAYAAGMLVMGTDRYPMNNWLPNGPLVPVRSAREASVGPGYNRFIESLPDPKDISSKIDEWYGRDVGEFSDAGREWAERNSWAVLGPQYRTLLEGLLA